MEIGTVGIVSYPSVRSRLHAALAYVTGRLAGDRALDQDLRHGDTADQAVASDEHDGMVLDLARVQTRRQLLLGALARLDDDSYGICLECQEPIGAARLAALPEVERCLTCQDQQERLAAQHRATETTDEEADLV